MSVAILTEATTTLTPTKQASQEATTLLAQAGPSREISITVNIEGKGSKELSSDLLDVLKDALAIISQGGQASVEAVPHDLTTTVAAKRLGVSRPTLMKLIREKKIPAHKVGSHTRLKAQDIDAFRNRMLEQKALEQKQAFEKLLDLESEIED